MFNKILIANRGEIAVRIMATCHEMGISSVAVYSEADKQARHVYEADEAYAIGPAPATQSYLSIPNIIDVARRCGVQAVHPGYGFLAENAAFAEACSQAGLVFIGPPASAIRLMGSKIAAKELAQSVGAPTVPGYNGSSQQDAVLLSEAERIGFPVLIKASAGGGGKGMRSVSNNQDFLEQLAGARREALAAFGDETVFLEKLIEEPRHIEIQVLADSYGEIIHLGERECSIQRRHQKILEESPSIALTPALRATMGEVAVRIARAAGYVNAGTIEFMLDVDKQFYFLEMNTRLQVEHPITELVTGLDLVRRQIRIAAGEPLGITQEQVTQRGHAIEVRIYAEDPEQNFLPSPGPITDFVQPCGPGIRLDSGISSQDEISQYYDPMIAKLIVSAEDRPAAIARLQRALEQSAIFGVTTNIAFLHTISTHPAFLAGATNTNFLTTHKLIPTSPSQNALLPDEVLIAAALYAVNQEFTNTVQESAQSPWKTLGPWRMVGITRTITYRYQSQDYTVAIRPTYAQENTWQIQIADRAAEEIAVTHGKNALIVLKRGAEQLQVFVNQLLNNETQVAFTGYHYRLQQRQPPAVSTAAYGGTLASTQKSLTAPMAGTIVKVLVHDNEQVEAQQVLMILTAMKMEHTITAPYAGSIRHVFYQEGTVVPGGTVVVEMA